MYRSQMLPPGKADLFVELRRVVYKLQGLSICLVGTGVIFSFLRPSSEIQGSLSDILLRII